MFLGLRWNQQPLKIPKALSVASPADPIPAWAARRSKSATLVMAHP